MTYEDHLKHADEYERLTELASNRHSLLSAADAKPRDGAGSNPVIGDP